MIENGQRTQTIQGLNFELKGEFYPEQYKVFDENNQEVAYVRLRHGELYVSDPDLKEHWWNTSIWDTAFPKNRRLKGEDFFDNDEERTFFLNFIAKIIHKKLQNPNWEAWQANGLYHHPSSAREHEFSQSIVLVLPSKFISILQIAITQQMAQMQALIDDGDTPEEILESMGYGNDRAILGIIQKDLANKYNVVKGDFYQLSQSADGSEITLQSFDKEIPENEQLVMVFSATSWEQAMTIKHKFLGFEPYKPLI